MRCAVKKGVGERGRKASDLRHLGLAVRRPTGMKVIDDKSCLMFSARGLELMNCLLLQSR